MNLEQILSRPDIWRAGSEASTVQHTGVTTGFAPLDAELPGHGWPRGALTELLPDREGIGELSLILPALAELTRAGRWVALIAPPHIPYAPALRQAGIDLARLLVLTPEDDRQAGWTMEQCLRNPAVGAAAGWLTPRDPHALRRLQLAAEAGDSLGFLYRAPAVRHNPSPAALRLRLRGGSRSTPVPHMAVEILKRRAGVLHTPVELAPRHAVA